MKVSDLILLAALIVPLAGCASKRPCSTVPPTHQPRLAMGSTLLMRATPSPELSGDLLETSLIARERTQNASPETWYEEVLDIPRVAGKKDREMAGFLELMQYYDHNQHRELPDRIVIRKENIEGLNLPTHIILGWKSKPLLAARARESRFEVLTLTLTITITDPNLIQVLEAAQSPSFLYAGF